LNLSNLSYSYQNYNIDINRIGGNEWEWHLKIPSGKGMVFKIVTSILRALWSRVIVPIGLNPIIKWR